MGGNDGGVVPGDIVEAKVICQNKHNIGLFGGFAGSLMGSVSVAWKQWIVVEMMKLLQYVHV